MQVLVLGMHRSGTSMLTGLLRMMGCWIGAPSEHTPVRADDPRGDLERLDVWQLHEDSLGIQGATWWRAARFDADAIPSAVRLSAKQRANDIVRSLASREPWAIEDPRLCLTLPIWRPALRRPFCLIVHRRPGEIAQSQRTRDGMDVATAIDLWELYTLAALRHSRGLPRMLVADEQLVADPKATAAIVLDRLLRHGASCSSMPTAEQIDEWVDPDLDRARTSEQDERILLSGAQRALRDSMVDGSAIADDPLSCEHPLLAHQRPESRGHRGIQQWTSPI